MQSTQAELQRFVNEGVEAMRRGHPAKARELFERVTQSGRANIQIWLLLATVCRSLEDAVAEEEALDAVLRLDPHVIRAMIMKGDCRVRAGDEGSALGLYMSARTIATGHSLPDEIVVELERIESSITDLKGRREERRERSMTAQGLPASQRSERFNRSLDLLAGRKQIFVQEPTNYYFPDLAAISFFDRGDFPWVAAVEAATAAIKAELTAILAEGKEVFRPYLRSDANRPRLDRNALVDSADWSALFLAENGQVFAEAVARAPTTWAALEAVPMPRIAQSPTVMFSLLRPGARIAPHTGTHNTRLICHLPLIVPPDCGFRVGSEVRQWEEGKLLIFDDTIEHEAWNDSDRDRVVLIFDIWRPELCEQERREVGALFTAALED